MKGKTHFYRDPLREYRVHIWNHPLGYSHDAEYLKGNYIITQFTNTHHRHWMDRYPVISYKELHKMHKENGLKGYSRKKKEQLINEYLKIV